jgi:hypothetical protein
MAPAAAQTPTATEVFNLRTECARLAREVEQEQAKPERHGMRDMQPNSIYDPKENRCYVILRYYNIEQTFGRSDALLYDGQTGINIAACRKQGTQPYSGFEASCTHIEDLERKDKTCRSSISQSLLAICQ